MPRRATLDVRPPLLNQLRMLPAPCAGRGLHCRRLSTAPSDERNRLLQGVRPHTQHERDEAALETVVAERMRDAPDPPRRAIGHERLDCPCKPSCHKPRTSAPTSQGNSDVSAVQTPTQGRTAPAKRMPARVEHNSTPHGNANNAAGPSSAPRAHRRNERARRPTRARRRAADGHEGEAATNRTLFRCNFEGGCCTSTTTRRSHAKEGAFHSW